MRATLDTAGVTLDIASELPWVSRLLAECCGTALSVRDPGSSAPGDALRIHIETSAEPFPTVGLSPITRGAWGGDAEVVLQDVCTAGFDLRLRVVDGRATATYRWRPPTRSHAAAWLLRSRFHLLVRSVLLHYPAMWWASTRGVVPLHAPACTTAGSVVLLAGAPGVGKTTLLLKELADGATAVSDNLTVSDGREVWGVVEPIRIEGGEGRRMPHGRRETTLPGRVGSLIPEFVAVVRRGLGSTAAVRRCGSAEAARTLVASTYMAGELRRYWAFAATLSAATGVGEVHPPIALIAADLARHLPCIEITLPAVPGPRLADLVGRTETTTCA
jgi:hypothetical protein